MWRGSDGCIGSHWMRRDIFRQLIHHRCLRHSKSAMTISTAPPLLENPEIGQNRTINRPPTPKIRNQSHTDETPRLIRALLVITRYHMNMKHPVFYTLLCSHLAKKLTVPDSDIAKSLSPHHKKRRFFCGQASCVITAIPCHQCLLAA